MFTGTSFANRHGETGLVVPPGDSAESVLEAGTAYRLIGGEVDDPYLGILLTYPEAADGTAEPGVAQTDDAAGVAGGDAG